MFSSLSSSANTSFNSTSSETAGVLSTVQSQNFEEKTPLTSIEEVERKLVSILTQVQQNKVKRLSLTSASMGRFYELANTLVGHEESVCSLAFLKNGVLASGSGFPENSIKLWDLTSYSCLSTFNGDTVDGNTLAVLPNGLLAASSYDNTIKLWDLTSNSCLSVLYGHTSWVFALAVLPNSQLVSGSRDNTIKLWDLAASSCLTTLQGHTSTVSALATLPNGQLASGSLDKTIKLWNLASSPCLFTLQGHTDCVYALAVLSNSQLASGSSDKTIKLWDLASHVCLSTLQGHTRCVVALVVLPNGRLASGSRDNTIKIWDLASQVCLSTLQGHTSFINALIVLPNDRLASGSLDKTIKIWESKTLSTKQLLSILNALKDNDSVTDLDLSGNRNILDDLIDPLIAILAPDTSSGSKSNTSLKVIDLQATGVSKKGVKKLEKAIHLQRLSIEVLADCPVEWMMIYFLIIFCRANRSSPFADSGLDLCKHGELGSFLGISSGFFARLRKNPSSSKRIASSPS